MKSWMASMAETEPPGELIYRLISERGSSAESSSSWCISRLTSSSSMRSDVGVMDCQQQSR